MLFEEFSFRSIAGLDKRTRARESAALAWCARAVIKIDLLRKGAKREREGERERNLDNQSDSVNKQTRVSLFSFPLSRWMELGV